ncbi:putative zinc finger protein [Echinococcus granulosus]|uniref:Zinc finger protein 474 n=1 Tax=Echinococcus granulosus TaxID=6210 RepID=A0A068W9Y8_ECHGR|nr:putative zinc finger protein [Echinococcus granulosus]CDS16476.1 zinc finger protein 474 [Echinococcus granulosus]
MPRPPIVVCYICHREFGTASIGIHEKSCLKKWRDANNKLPPSERLPEPIKPTTFPSPSPDTQVASDTTVGFVDNRQIKTTGQDPNVEAYNAAAAQTKTLATCPKCSRHFAPDRLKVHQAHCKPPPKLARRHTYEARRPDVEVHLLRTPLGGKTSVPKTSIKRATSSKEGLIACKICGRTFASDRIERHQAACRATPVKPPSFKSKPTGRRRSTSTNRTQPNQATPTCGSCGAKVTAGEKFCVRCGTPIPPMCSQCGAPLVEGAKFCAHCGRPVQANKNNANLMKTRALFATLRCKRPTGSR